MIAFGTNLCNLAKAESRFIVLEMNPIDMFDMEDWRSRSQDVLVSVNKLPSVLAAWQALYRHSKSSH